MLRRGVRRLELMLHAGEASESDLELYRKLMRTSEEKPLTRKRVSEVPRLNKRDPETRAALALAAQDLSRRALKDATEAGPVAEWRAKKASWGMMRWECSESEVIKTRVLDVDAVDMDEMHHMFMYTLTRRMPAEKAVKIIGRLGVYRDKHNSHSLENLMTDVATLFGPYHGPELEALWTRCYATIGVPFMLDYVRRFGRFSRQYLAQEVDRSNKPRFFDFCRYPSGRRPLPPILTNPYELWAWVRLLPKCSAKRYLVQRLLAEKIRTKGDDVNLLGDSSRVERALSVSERGAEQLLLRPVKKLNRPDVHKLVQAEKIAATVQVTDEIFDLQNIPVHAFGQAAASSALAVQPDGAAESDAVSPRPQSHWWTHRKDRKFLYRGRQYKLTDGQGWRRIYRPVLDYGRDRRMLLGLKRKEKMTKKKIHFKQLYQAMKRSTST